MPNEYEESFDVLAAEVAGVDDISQVNKQNFKQGLQNLDISRKASRKAIRGLNKFQKKRTKGNNFTFNENETFSIQDKNNLGLSGSGIRKGNQVGFGASDLLNIGDDVSNFAGVLNKHRNLNSTQKAQVEAPQQEVEINVHSLSDEVPMSASTVNATASTPSSGARTKPKNKFTSNIESIVEPVIEEPTQEPTQEFALQYKDYLYNVRPTIPIEERGELGQKYPDLYEEWLQDDVDGPLESLLQDAKDPNRGKLASDSYPEQFRRWVKKNKFDEGVGRQAMLSRGETFDTLNDLAPARQVNPLDFQDKNNNFGDMFNAATLFIGGAGVQTYKSLKKANALSKPLAKKTPKTLEELTASRTKNLLTATKNNLGKIKNKFNKTKPIPKVTPPATKIATATKKLNTASTKKLAEKTSSMKSKLNQSQVNSEIEAFLGKHPSAKKMILSNGSRIKINPTTNSWKLFAAGGKIQASNLLR